MFDSLSFIISFFILGFLVLIVLVGIKFFHSLVTAGQSTNSYIEENDRQLREDSRENSSADGLMGIDAGDDYSDILFPEEEES